MVETDRQKRLRSDFQQMQNLRGQVVDWKSLSGAEPYVDKYEMTVRLRTIISSSPSYRDVHTLTIELPPSYPDQPPHILMVTRPVPFHPNWWPAEKGAHWCYGTWSLTESLGQHVVRMLRTLQFDPVITNPRSPANSDARSWYDGRQSSGIFPCDRTALPDPTRSRFNINPTTSAKKFEIR